MNPKVVRAGVVLLLGGCSAAPRHDVSVSRRLRELPVRSLVVAPPGFPEKFQRKHKDDYAEMLPERRPETGQRVIEAARDALSASLTVDAGWTPDEAAREWAETITKSLAVGRVPLNVDPHPVQAEAVLLVGVHTFGARNVQLAVQPLWFKPKRFGDPKFEHVVRLVAILVDPRNGDVLMDLDHEERALAPAYDQAALAALTRAAASEIRAAVMPSKDTP